MTALVATHDPVLIALADRAVRLLETVDSSRQPRVGELVWHRARAQVAVLVAVLAVMVAGSALVGVCVLLVTASPQRGLQLTMVRAPLGTSR